MSYVASLAAKDAILRTGAQRLRPVLLTTVTTILGLMPMVLQVNIDLFNRHIDFGAPSTQWWVIGHGCCGWFNICYCIDTGTYALLVNATRSSSVIGKFVTD